VAPELANAVKRYIAGQGLKKSTYLFQASRGLPVSRRNVLHDSLHPILKRMGREKCGLVGNGLLGSSPAVLTSLYYVKLNNWRCKYIQLLMGLSGEPFLDSFLNDSKEPLHVGKRRLAIVVVIL
jgi:hypothetical protein